MSDSSQRPLAPRLSGLFAALFIIAGAVLLWLESRYTVTLYGGSYEPLTMETFYLGPSPYQIVGEILLALGFAALCMTLGFLLGRKITQSAQRRMIFIVSLILGALLILGGIGLVLWQAYQVQTFGWFAYAPLSESTFVPQTPLSMVETLGKLCMGLGLGVLGLGIGLRSRFGAPALS